MKNEKRTPIAAIIIHGKNAFPYKAPPERVRVYLSSLAPRMVGIIEDASIPTTLTVETEIPTYRGLLTSLE